MPAYTMLNGFSKPESAGAKSFTEQLAENLAEFFNWGLLEAGAYDNVPVTTPGTADPYDDSTMHPKHMEGVADGRIWGSPHQNWVWETGIDSERQPIVASGVYVNGSFYAENTVGTYKHFLDFRKGRVVFDSPIPTTSVVQVSHSHRWVEIYDENVPWFRDVIFDAYRFEVGDNPGSGVIGLLQQNAVQLPAIVVETVPQTRFKPRQIGDLSQWVYKDFLFHIIAEAGEDRTFLQDAILLQKDRGIYLYDVNARMAANQYPLDWHGALRPGAMTYPQLVTAPPDGFRYKTCFFNRVAGEASSALLPLFRATLRVTVEAEFTEI